MAEPELDQMPEAFNEVLKAKIEDLSGQKSYVELLEQLTMDVRSAEYILNKKAFLFEVEVLADPDEGYLQWKQNPWKRNKYQIFYKHLPKQVHAPYLNLEDADKIKLAKFLPVLLSEVIENLNEEVREKIE